MLPQNINSNPRIEVGDYTCYDDFEDVYRFEQKVKYLIDFTGDKLIIGKFCMIASGVTFNMNGANHLTDGVSTYPFAIFGSGWEPSMDGKAYPDKGNVVVGNDVWIGYNVTIMAGVTIGDGAMIATHATVTKNVAPYTIAVGNPAVEIRKRFSNEQIQLLLELQWWNWQPEKITGTLALLTSNNIKALRTCS